MRRLLPSLFVLAPLWLASGAAATAQTPAADTWQFTLTPYFWAASLDGDVAAVPGLPAASVDASFSDIIQNTNVAGMIEGELRRGRSGALLELVYLDLEADDDMPGPVFGDAELESRTLFATLGGFYDVVSTDRIDVQLVAGGRLWYVENEITLTPGLANGRTDQPSETWVDPLIGLRWHGELGRGFFLAGGANAGALGGADKTWEVIGTLGYRFSDRIAARAGYRHLKVDYEDGGFVWDVELSGPIVGVTVRF